MGSHGALALSQEGAFLHRDQAEPPALALGKGVEAAAPVGDGQNVALIGLDQFETGFGHARVPGHVAETFLGDAVHRQRLCRRHPGHHGRHGDRHSEIVGPFDLFSQAAERRTEPAPIEEGGVQAVRQSTEHHPEVLDLGPDGAHRIDASLIQPRRRDQEAVALVIQQGNPLQRVIVNFPGHPGPFLVLRGQQLAGVVAVQRQESPLIDYQGRAERYEDDEDPEERGDEYPPKGCGGIGHRSPRAMTIMATVSATARTSSSAQS